jgi:hypothetical protein
MWFLLQFVVLAESSAQLRPSHVDRSRPDYFVTMTQIAWMIPGI